LARFAYNHARPLLAVAAVVYMRLDRTGAKDFMGYPIPRKSLVNLRILPHAWHRLADVHLREISELTEAAMDAEASV
jgi:hypothetical protein